MANLIEQGLKQMVVVLVNQGEGEAGLAKPARGLGPGEAPRQRRRCRHYLQSHAAGSCPLDCPRLTLLKGLLVGAAVTVHACDNEGGRRGFQPASGGFAGSGDDLAGWVMVRGSPKKVTLRVVATQLGEFDGIGFGLDRLRDDFDTELLAPSGSVMRASPSAGRRHVRA